MTTETCFEESGILTADELTRMVCDKDVKVIGFHDHKKASEKYVVLSVTDDGKEKEWRLPYYYRRTDVRVDTVAELVDYVRRCRPRLTVAGVRDCKAKYGKLANSIFGKNANVTLAIFRSCSKSVATGSATKTSRIRIRNEGYKT